MFVSLITLSSCSRNPLVGTSWDLDLGKYDKYILSFVNDNKVEARKIGDPIRLSVEGFYADIEDIVYEGECLLSKKYEKKFITFGVTKDNFKAKKVTVYKIGEEKPIAEYTDMRLFVKEYGDKFSKELDKSSITGFNNVILAISFKDSKLFVSFHLLFSAETELPKHEE